MLTINVELRQVYGETKAYPLCDKARLFAKMLGTKTLTRSALADIQRLGYVVEVHGLSGPLEPIAA